MTDQTKDHLGGPLSNAGGIGGGGRGLEGDLTGPGQGAPAGADDRYPVGMGDDDRSHSGETAGAGFAAGGSGPTTERYDGRDDDVVNQNRTSSIGEPGEQVRDPGEATDDAGDFQTYSPSTVVVNRNRLQGVGASDIDRQRDPTGAVSSDQLSRQED